MLLEVCIAVSPIVCAFRVMRLGFGDHKSSLRLDLIVDTKYKNGSQNPIFFEDDDMGQQNT